MVDGAYAMYEWMTFMTTSTSAPTPGPGWTMVASSDGYGANNSNPTNTSKTYIGNNHISSVSVLKGYKSWFVLQAPDGYKQISVQSLSKSSLVSGAVDPASWGTFRIKMAPNGFDLSSGTQFKVPAGKTANSRQSALGITLPHAKKDEIVWEGTSSSDEAPKGVDFFGKDQIRAHMAANDSDGYGFYMFTMEIGGSSPVINSVIMLDPMLNGSYPDTHDKQPFVWFGRKSGYSTALSINDMNYAGLQNAPALYFQGSFFNYATSSETFAGVGLAAPYLRDSTNRQDPKALVGRLPSNPHTGKDDLFPAIWVKPDISFWGNATRGPGTYSADGWPNLAFGYKGISSLLKLVSTSRATLSTLSVSSSGDRIVLNNVSLPWNGSTPTI